MRQVWDNRPGAIVGIMPDQIVEHAGCGPKNEDGTGLMNVEMRRTQRHTMAQHTAGFSMGSGALSLNAEPSNFSGTGAAMAREADNP
jgi:hypothetical protein